MKRRKQPFFKVENTSILHTLALAKHTSSLYSLNELGTAMDSHSTLLQVVAQKNQAALTTDEGALLELVQGVEQVTQLRHSFDYLTPLPAVDLTLPDLPKNLRNNPADYQRWAPYAEPILRRLQQIIRSKGEDIDHYTQAEQQLAEWSYLLTGMRLQGMRSRALAVIPAQGAEMISPWHAVMAGSDAPELVQWKRLRRAYLQHDAASWQQAVSALQQPSTHPAIAGWKLTAEWWQNRLPLLELAIVCTLAALLSALLRREGVAILLLAAGALCNGVLVALRVLVLGRPPVGTLYESMLFAALVVGLMALGLCRTRHRHEGLVLGGLLPAGLLLVSGVYAPAGDSRGVLGAVLNTNFWLATHVLCIVTGYGTALITGTLAHMALWKPSFRLHRLVHGWGIIALLFTAMGTILGGVWADQSWGRFWGWDPKENGALLIVLWLAWIQHMRLLPGCTLRRFAMGMAFLPVIVSLSWFGVNLLGVGLHSYGFTTNAALGLAAFCLMETVAVCWLGWRASGMEIKQ